jgi:RecA-family ATPase
LNAIVPSETKSEAEPLVNLLAEQALLGSLLTKPALIKHVPASFHPIHFSGPDHAEIYKAITDLGSGAQGGFAVAQAVALGDRDKGVYIASLLNACSGLTPGVIEAGCAAITGLWHRRALVEIADKIRDGAHSPNGTLSADSIIAKAASSLDAMARLANTRSALEVVDPRDLQGLIVPDRQWIVQDWLPIGYTTANYGDGGTGKTLLAQQLMTSCATGQPWLGLAAKRCKVFALFCEDDENELHRRQDSINQQYGIDFSDLGDMRWVSGVGVDNLLVTFGSDGVGVHTARFDELTKAAKEFGAELVVIDTAADTFGGNENDRGQVRQYVGAGLNKLAHDIGGAVLLNAHPSRSGMSASGDLDGGSTSWSNTVRSRWSLARPTDDDTPADTDERILTRRKANYSQVGAEIKMRWERGVLVPAGGGSEVSGVIARAHAAEVFLDILDRCKSQGMRISNSKHSGNFAPKVFAGRPDARGYRVRDFEQAMKQLFAENRIELQTYGRAGDARQEIVRTSQEQPEAPE